MTQAAQLPDFFTSLLDEQYPAEDVARIVAGCSAERPVTLRANTLRASRADVAAALDEAGIGYDTLPWYEDAFIVRDVRERVLWDMPLYQEGGVYLQSLSSMIPALVLGAQPGEDVCDMCAAPGGKTTQIAALTGNKAYVTACEMHEPRAQKLEHNLQKLGAPNAAVLRLDARTMDDFFSFDRILVDAPCSGSGTVRAGDARMQKRFTEALLRKSQKSQRALLSKALKLVKPGGTLVYSTCSVLAGENEDIVENCLRQAKCHGAFELQPVVETPANDSLATAEQDAQKPDAPAPFFTAVDAKSLPLLPTRLEGALCLAPSDLYEGFFVAKIKRTG